MTTKAKHAYTVKSCIEYDNLDFNPDDPEPLPDGMYQYPIFAEIFGILDAHLNTLGDPETIFRSSNTVICYNPNNLNVRVGPDFYVAFDVDAEAIKRRLMYLPWEAGKPPDLALEVGSPSTGNEDTDGKRGIYARIGVREYWRFDPSGGDYYGEPLVGEKLVDWRVPAFRPGHRTRRGGQGVQSFVATVPLLAGRDADFLQPPHRRLLEEPARHTGSVGAVGSQSTPTGRRTAPSTGELLRLIQRGNGRS